MRAASLLLPQLCFCFHMLWHRDELCDGDDITVSGSLLTWGCLWFKIWWLKQALIWAYTALSHDLDQPTGFLISQHHYCVSRLAVLCTFCSLSGKSKVLFQVVGALLAELLSGLNLELWIFFFVIMQATAKVNKNFLNCEKSCCLHCCKSHGIKQ